MSDNNNNKFNQPFQIIHHQGKVMEAIHPRTGTKFYRQDTFFIPEFGGFVPAMDDDDHFIFETPVSWKDEPSFQCTCGSMAVFVGSNVYKEHASPEGMLLVCHYYMTFGHHTNMSVWE